MNTVLSWDKTVEPRVELNGQRGTYLTFFSIYVSMISCKIVNTFHNLLYVSNSFMKNM